MVLVLAEFSLVSVESYTPSTVPAVLQIADELAVAATVIVHGSVLFVASFAAVAAAVVDAAAAAVEFVVFFVTPAAGME